MGIFRVGTATAVPGGKGQGGIEVSRRHDGSAIIIPVMLVNGREEGKTLVIQAGIHGNEYPGIAAAWRLVESLNPSQLRGQLIVVPVLNTEAFAVDDRVNDIDHQDMNRIFPGKSDGTLTERTAHVMLTEIISRADCLVDLHCAGTGMISPVSIMRRGQEELTFDLTKAAGFEFIWIGGELGTGKGVQATILALRQGIPATTIEAGGGRELQQEHVDDIHEALLSIMRYLGMLDGQPRVPKRRVYYTADYWPQTRNGGFFQSYVQAGQRVKKGDLIATVHDVFHNEMERLEAPRDGLICLINKKSAIKPGAYACIFGDIVQEEFLE